MFLNLKKIYFAIPVINALANVTTNYFPSGTLNPGTFRIIVLTLFFMFFFNKIRIIPNLIFFLVVFYLFYNLILITTQPYFSNSIQKFIRLSFPILMIFPGFTYVKNEEDIKKVFNSIYISLIILVFNYVIANIFKLGGSMYMEDSFYIGGAGVGATNELAIFIVISLAYSQMGINKKKKLLLYSFIIIGVLIVVLAFRRGAWVTLGFGILFYIYFSGEHKVVFKKLVPFLIILTLAFPLYSGLLIERYEHRKSKREGSITNYEVEGRYLELGIVTEQIFGDDLKMTLFGTHNLASEIFFGGRPLHNGYMSILHGSGLIGVILFVFLLLGIYIYEIKVFNHSKFKNDKILHGVFLSSFIGLLVYLLSSRFYGFIFSLPVFFVYGAIISYFKNNMKSYNYKKTLIGEKVS